MNRLAHNTAATPQISSAVSKKPKARIFDRHDKPTLKSLMMLKEDLNHDELWLLELSPSEIMEVVFASAMEKAASEIQSLRLKPGDTAPDFILPDVGNGGMAVSSKLLRSKGPLVVMFLGNVTAAKDDDMTHTQAEILQWLACGATVVAISPNFTFKNKEAAAVTGSSSTLFLRDSDDYRVAQMFQAAFSLKPVLKPFFKEHDAAALSNFKPGSTTDENCTYIMALPATYVIDPDGTVLYSYINTSTYTHDNANTKDLLASLPPSDASQNLKNMRDKMLWKAKELVEQMPIMEHVMDVSRKTFGPLEDTGITLDCLQSGDIAPDFKSRNAATGEMVQTKRLRDVYQQTLIITFYRGQWCPFCNVALEAMKAYVPKFAERGATLIAISPQTYEYSMKTSKELKLTTFPLVSDVKNEIAKKFRVCYKLDDTMIPFLGSYIKAANTVSSEGSEKAGEDGENDEDEETYKLPLCATYVVHRSGQIIYSQIQVDYTQRAEPEEILNALPPASPVASASATKLVKKQELKTNKDGSTKSIKSEARRNSLLGTVTAIASRGLPVKSAKNFILSKTKRRASNH